MISEENGEHDESGHQVAADDGPWRQRVEEPRRESHDHGQNEDLEAAEEHEDPEEDSSIAIDEGERHTVGHRVLEDETGGDGESAGIAEPMEQRSREKGGRPERDARRQIIEQEPDGDGGRSRQTDHDPLEEHALSSHDHVFAFSARLVSLSRPGRMALKKAFWMSRRATSHGLTWGLSSRPEISARVATSSRERFFRSRPTPPTTLS